MGSRFREYVNGTEAFRQGYTDALDLADDPTGYVAWAEQNDGNVVDYRAGVAAGAADAAEEGRRPCQFCRAVLLPCPVPSCGIGWAHAGDPAPTSDHYCTDDGGRHMAAPVDVVIEGQRS